MYFAMSVLETFYNFLGKINNQIPLCVCALRSVVHGQSKRSANVPLTLTGKPNPAQITRSH